MDNIRIVLKKKKSAYLSKFTKVGLVILFIFWKGVWFYTFKKCKIFILFGVYAVEAIIYIYFIYIYKHIHTLTKVISS